MGFCLQKPTEKYQVRMDSSLVAMIPCVLDFLDLDANELLAAGVLTDTEDEGILAGFFTKHVIKTLGEESEKDETLTITNISTLSPSDFRTHFRMSYTIFCDLLSMLEENTSFSTLEGKDKISKSKLEQGLMVTLHYLGSLDSQKELAECFELDEMTLVAQLKQTVHFLYELMQLLISWPDRKEAQSIIEGFKKISLLPNVLGAIDVTHIHLETNETDKKFYLNAKGKPTILLQAVCDHNMRFLHCCTGWPGSVDDVSVLHDSDLFQDIKENQTLFFPEGCFLVGDQAYPLYSWLLTPYEGSDSTLNDKQIQYNFYVNVARDKISKAFLHNRRRFPRLEKIDVHDLEYIVKIILVTCAVHNFCIDQGDTELFVDTMITEERLSIISEPDVRFINAEAVLQREKLALSLGSSSL